MHTTSKLVLLMVIVASAATVHAQQRYLYIYDHASMSTDSMPVNEVPTWFAVSTPWNVGRMTGRTDLPTQMPSTDEMVGTMSKMRPAREFTNVAHYPARTVGSLRIMRDGIPRPSCSATLVGPKWVLTASHCLYEVENAPRHFFWDYRFYPAWDDSSSQTLVHFSRVIRTYTVRVPGDSPIENDVALLELDEPIGDELGWLGMMTFPNDDVVENAIAHRLSYPAYFDVIDPARYYDGDTLWYRYGSVVKQQHTLHTEGAMGIPGESGSSVILSHSGGYAAAAVLQYASSMASQQLDSTTFETFARLVLPTIASVADGQGAGTPFTNNESEVQRYTMQGELVSSETMLHSGVYLEVTTLNGNRTTRLINVVR